MGRLRGLEPPTSGTTNRCSNQLSYNRHRGGRLCTPCAHPRQATILKKVNLKSVPSGDAPLPSTKTAVYRSKNAQNGSGHLADKTPLSARLSPLPSR